MNIFDLKNIFYEHSKNQKLNYLQTVKIDSSTQVFVMDFGASSTGTQQLCGTENSMISL